MSEIFLDTETTGLSFKEGHKIVEIACIETKDLVPTNKVFHQLKTLIFIKVGSEIVDFHQLLSGNL